MNMTHSNAAVIVAGSINVDLLVGVPTLPGAGETVLGDRFIQQNGGKSANQAVAAARVGAQVTMLGAVGGDDLGRSALAGLDESALSVSELVGGDWETVADCDDAGVPTPSSCV